MFENQNKSKFVHTLVLAARNMQTKSLVNGNSFHICQMQAFFVDEPNPTFSAIVNTAICQPTIYQCNLFTL